jgi:hypothetical protein
MDTEIDWQRELDSSFGTGEDVEVARYVASGHRAVRRRRGVTAALVTASLVIAGGAVWATSPGSTPRSDAPVATGGARASDPSVDDRAEDAAREARRERLERMRQKAMKVRQSDFLGNPALISADKLVLASGAGPVLERVPNPMGYTRAGWTSLGIRVMQDGAEQYSLIASFGEGDWSINTAPATGDFDVWLAAAVSSQATLDAANGDGEGVDTVDDWVDVGLDGRLAPALAKVGVVDQRTGVDTGAGEGATSTVAHLLVAGHDQFVVVRDALGAPDYLLVPAHFATLDDLVAYVRQRNASGEGVR